ncbi:hypothetical protein [Paenibacillus senegalensis]|uniref:hypothetical protein n=1 Tax=Paenibacillus senegalensis TaxID=1465766 RepID=UPI00028A2694|nr:hypothetical protein [Paenibacillus senegalensis]
MSGAWSISTAFLGGNVLVWSALRGAVSVKDKITIRITGHQGNVTERIIEVQVSNNEIGQTVVTARVIAASRWVSANSKAAARWSPMGPSGCFCIRIQVRVKQDEHAKRENSRTFKRSVYSLLDSLSRQQRGVGEQFAKEW